jgi:hypothetical protein
VTSLRRTAPPPAPAVPPVQECTLPESVPERLEPLLKLEAIAASLQEIGHPHGLWFRVAMGRVFSGDNIDDAFDLSCSAGEESPAMQLRRHRRNEGYRDIARRFFSSLSISAQAQEIHTIADRYSASAWRSDRDLDHPPTGYSFVSCNWKARKAKFVSSTETLKFVSF